MQHRPSCEEEEEDDGEDKTAPGEAPGVFEGILRRGLGRPRQADRPEMRPRRVGSVEEDVSGTRWAWVSVGRPAEGRGAGFCIPETPERDLKSSPADER